MSKTCSKRLALSDYSAPLDEAGLSRIDLYTAGKYRSTAPLAMAEVVILFHFHCHRGCQQCTSLSDSVLLRRGGGGGGGGREIEKAWLREARARYSRFPAQGSITSV